MEGAFAASCLAAGITLYVIAPSFVRGWAFNIPGTTDIALAPSFFPRLTAILLAIASLIVLATIPLRNEPISLLSTKAAEYRNVALGIVGILLYLVGVDLLGFVTSSAVFVIVATWLGGYRRPIIVVATAIAVAFALRAIFRFGLNVNLPTGLLI